MVVTKRREVILKHIARYGITLRPVLERLFGSADTSSIDHDLKALKDDGLLSVVQNGVSEPADARTKYSYYYLTRKACGLLGAPDSRARRPGGYSLERGLAILWLCCMSKSRCHRLSEDEVQDIFAASDCSTTPEHVRNCVTGFHCITSGKQHFQVLNLYATKANSRDTLSELKKRVDDARRVPSIADAIGTQEYIFAILVETTERAAELRQWLAKHVGNDGFVFRVIYSPRSWRN